MKRIRRVCKAFPAFLAVAMIPLVLMGCGKSDEQPSGEHPSKEQPAEQHPPGEHPTEKTRIEAPEINAGTTSLSARKNSQTQGEEILRKMAEVNKYWLISPPPTVHNYQYDFALVGHEPKTFANSEASRARGAARQGITYSTALHALAAEPSAATIVKMQTDQDTITLEFQLKEDVKAVCGNGINGPYQGYASFEINHGALVIDSKRMVPLRCETAQLVEIFSDYIEMADSHYVPLNIKIDIIIGSRPIGFDWKFRLYEPGLWLLDTAYYQVGELDKNGSRPAASISNMKINGQPAHPIPITSGGATDSSL